jgi:hypothetical protein
MIFVLGQSEGYVADAEWVQGPSSHLG